MVFSRELVGVWAVARRHRASGRRRSEPRLGRVGVAGRRFAAYSSAARLLTVWFRPETQRYRSTAREARRPGLAVVTWMASRFRGQHHVRQLRRDPRRYARGPGYAWCPKCGSFDRRVWVEFGEALPVPPLDLAALGAAALTLQTVVVEGAMSAQGAIIEAVVYRANDRVIEPGQGLQGRPRSHRE